MNFRRSSGSITPDSCATHFDHLTTAHGIVHPSRALRQLQKAGHAGKNDATFASAVRQGLVLECEACVRWDGAKLQARQRTLSVVHSDVLRRMEAVLLAASAPPFSAYVNTRDNAFCHVAGQIADHVAGHGFSPPALLRAQTLLPLQLDQLEWIIIPNTTKPGQQPQRWPVFDGCFWRGGNTGWHKIQSAFNVNRTTCLQTQTDRQCVVNRHMPKANLMCRKRKCPATAADRQTIERSQCMLAVDGNSYATIFSRIMLAGRLAVRVGGWDALTQRRLSTFEWCLSALEYALRRLQLQSSHCRMMSGAGTSLFWSRESITSARASTTWAWPSSGSLPVRTRGGGALHSRGRPPSRRSLQSEVSCAMCA